MQHNESTLAPSQQKTYEIIVNGRPRVVTEHKLSYAAVVELAYPGAVNDEALQYTVAYANPHGRDGTLAEGDKPVVVKDGMSFNVGRTNRS